VKAHVIARLALVPLWGFFVVSPELAADPPAAYISPSQAVPGVFGTNTANGDGVFGQATTGRGIIGVSESGIGVQGTTKAGPGVVGVSETQAGVEGYSQSDVGLRGTTRAPSGAGGEFQNDGGGDLIRAGAGGVFRVSNTGDIFVRGQLVGATGPEGPPGPPGAPVRTVAVCGGGDGQGRCNCTGREIARQRATTATPGCSVTSDTGACALPIGASGVCCICAP
jgi:hypothetical protein